GVVTTVCPHDLVPRVALSENRSVRRVVAWSVAVTLTTAASAVADVREADGLKPYAIPGQGVSLALPSTWRAIDYRQARSQRQIRRFARGNPDFIEAIEVLEDPGSPFKFVALDPAVHLRVAGGRPVRANMTVIVTPVSPGLTFEGHRRALVAQIRRQIGPARDDVVMINGQKAVRIRAYREDTSVDPAVTFLELQYAFL